MARLTSDERAELAIAATVYARLAKKYDDPQGFDWLWEETVDAAADLLSENLRQANEQIDAQNKEINKLWERLHWHHSSMPQPCPHCEEENKPEVS